MSRGHITSVPTSGVTDASSVGRNVMTVAGVAQLMAILGTGTASSSTYLRGDGTWVDPTSSLSASIASEAASRIAGDAAVAAASQPLDADLTAIAALTTQAYGRSLLTLANQAALFAALGTGTPNNLSFLRGDGTWSTVDLSAADVVNTLPIARGGTNQTSFTNNAAVYFDGTHIASMPAVAYATSGSLLTVTAQAISDVPLTAKGMASQSGDLFQAASSSTTLVKITAAGLLSVTSSGAGAIIGGTSAPKGTGNQKLEVAGSGTGSAAFGSLAISRADSTSASVVGSIDFYTVSTLAAQILVNQVSGGAGGVNYISFSLGSAGTMVTPMQLQYSSGSVLGSLVLGASNGTLQGKLQVTNYANAAITTCIQLANPVSSGSTGGTGILWIDGAGGNSIGQVRTSYMAAAGVGDVVVSVGTGTTNGLQDFVRFTNTGHMDFYLLDSLPANQKVGGIQATWFNSTDATRVGQVAFTAMNTTNENTAFYYWADTSTSTRMVFAANTIQFTGTGSVNFAGGIQMPSTAVILFNTAAATSGAQLTNSGTVRFNTSYWNGAASTGGMITTWGAQQVATFVSGVQLVMACNPGAGSVNMFAVGSNTTVENSLIQLSSVLVATNLAYNAFTVLASWLDNAAATRRSSASINVWNVTTAQNGVQIDGVSSGNQPNVSLVLGSTASSYGSGTGVIFIANRGAAPSGTPSGGGILYVEAGALKYKGSSGTPTTIAVA